MIGPTLSARIEERVPQAGERVFGNEHVPFGSIARPACGGEIVGVVEVRQSVFVRSGTASRRAGYRMIDGQRPADDLAVLTAPIGPLDNEPADAC